VIQEQLFALPVQAPATQSVSKLPPSPPKPATIAEPLGQCVKCGASAEVASKSGDPKSVYCKQCGRCGRKNKDDIECGTSIEHFVKHPRLGIWCCSCVVRFDAFFDKREKAMKKWSKP